MRTHIGLIVVLITALFMLTGCPDDNDSITLETTSTGNSPGGNGGDGGDPDNGGNGGDDADIGEPVVRSRYALNNQCFAIRANQRNTYLVRNDTGGYRATAATAEAGEAFFMKPAALGQYLLFDSQSRLLSAAAPVGTHTLEAPTDDDIWTVLGVGDTTTYPATPVAWFEPEVDALDRYRNFADAQTAYPAFTLAADGADTNLAIDSDGQLTTAAASASAPSQSFTFARRAAGDCAEFPEAQSNTIGETFKGTTADGRVLGMADVHVHISATEFLGGAEWGAPFSRFGVTDALGDGAERHGPNGSLDVLGAFYVGDFDGHQTAGWPTFPDWPAADSLTHEAIYWKWLERAWKAGLRVAVNDLVENQTLCELLRNLNGANPLRNCNSMISAKREIGTMYAMQDYIDAQYGGPGKGWFRIVLDPQQARTVIEDGKLAVVLGIEISNLFDCKLNYSPLRTQEPFEETGEGGLENSYDCAMTETGADNEILTQLTRLKDLGVRQIITVHEFDNAFGGNGLFNDFILNVGNRENSGGLPSDDLAAITAFINSDAISQLQDPSSNNQDGLINLEPLGKLSLSDYLGRLFSDPPELPTGEFWTTYDCPDAENTADFSGYLFSDHGGIVLQTIPGLGPLTSFTGQGGRPGGLVPFYPDTYQCNARWLTPIGQYAFEQIMRAGMIFDFDHMELEMKNQLLELAEAQTPVYPLVSTHGTFGGITNDQARRVLRGGGFIYPSMDNGHDMLNKMEELRLIYDAATADMADADKPLYGFGFGTDTNGLSKQAARRSTIATGQEVRYPYTLFDGKIFDEIDDFDTIAGVVFEQPRTRAPDGRGRTWSLDIDGSAHYGMLSGMVEEIRQEGNAEQMRNLFDSAEHFLRTWERTLESSAAIEDNGFAVPAGVLRAAPKPNLIPATLARP
ncbi:ricin B lectin [Salinisphaera sp. T5B8]|uniref:hypothetical protein n=2 Tax=unclassified Salinisphaera TaxID=2649847 RepID=UPI00333F17B8